LRAAAGVIDSQSICSQSTRGGRDRDEEGKVSHKKSVLIVMAALSAIVLAGLVSVSLSASEPVRYSPNHHPRSANG
jgi:hypothetical protein